MKINEAREKFIQLMNEIERELGATIVDVHLWKEKSTVPWSQNSFIERLENHASITFGDKRTND